MVIRGNSGSGKSSIAAAVRKAFGQRGCAIVGQDVIRRDMLKEQDTPAAANIGLIDLIARYALDHGYHVIVEGILAADRYGEMLRRLAADHLGSTSFFYLDVRFEETLRRHATRPQANDYGEPEMRRWYRPLDRLDCVGEVIVPASSSLDSSIELIGASLRHHP